MPFDEAVVEFADVAVLLERRQRAAQAVGLLGREARADDGDLHRLFLEQGHAEGLAQHLAQRVGGEADLLLPVPAAQEGVDHVALDRPRADDRDLDHEVVEAARPHPGQEVHLGAGFHLKDAKAVGAAEHVGRSRGPRAAGWQGVKRWWWCWSRRSKALRMQDSMPSARMSTLRMPQRVDVVLVPADDGAVLHRRVLDGAQARPAGLR